MKCIMETLKKFKIVVLEDDDFYNKLLSRYLTAVLTELGVMKGFRLRLSSYTSYKDCMMNFDDDTTLLFTDYYLRNGNSASQVIRFVNNTNSKCKVVVISQIQNMQTAVSTLLEGAIDFIRKDRNTLQQCRDIAEAVINERLILRN